MTVTDYKGRQIENVYSIEVVVYFEDAPEIRYIVMAKQHPGSTRVVKVFHTVEEAVSFARSLVAAIESECSDLPGREVI